MKILILTNSLRGLYSFRREVIMAIRNAGNKVTISTPIDEKKDYFEDECRLIDTQFNRKGKNPLKDFSLMFWYCKLLKQEKPDIVLSYTIKPNVYGGMACQICGVPQIVNITGLGSAIENSGWLQHLAVLLYKIGLRKADIVFFQNKANMDFCVKRGVTKSKYALLPGSGVNLKYHSLQPYPPDNGKVKFLFIGRILKHKGIEEYFQAAEIIKTKYPNSEFYILGRVEGNYQKQLNQLMEVGCIKHFGVTSDVRPYIKSVECTVMPSYYEGMSNVNLESAANGRPVITSDVPGCREMVDDGITGLLVKARDADSLIKAIERFILMPYEQKREMGVAARRKVEREFDRQIVVNAYIKELESFANV